MRASLKQLLNYKLFALAGLSVLVFFLYFWRLDSLTVGLSQAELSTRAASNSLDTIIDNPLYAPHHILQLLLSHLSSDSAFYLRLPSAIFAVVMMWSFYYMARSWFGKTIGVLAGLIAASTPLVILSARSATPEILLLAPIALLSIYTWLEKTKNHAVVAWFILCMVAASVLYVPGGAWFVVGSIFFGRRNLIRKLSSTKLIRRQLGLILGLIVAAPLLYGLSKSPDLIQPLLLLPNDWPSIVEGLQQFGWAVLALIAQAPSHIDLIIGRLPILDATQIVLLIFGTYAIHRLARAKIYGLILLIVFGLIASSLNRNTLYLMLSLPSIFMLIGAGLRYLFIEWLSVFPRNPIPKYLAFSLMSLLVGLHITYGLNYSLSAWPNSASTKNIYVLK